MLLESDRGLHFANTPYANRWTDGTLLVKHFLTHGDYDKEKWCKDCVLPKKEKKK